MVCLDGIIAVVDAEQLPAQVALPATRDLVFSQIGYSDLAILSKVDLAVRSDIVPYNSCGVTEPETCLVVIADSDTTDHDDVVGQFDTCRVASDDRS